MRRVRAFSICHRICSLPAALDLKLVSEQDILTGWWIYLPHVRFGYLHCPPLLFLSTFYVSFTSLRLCSIFFLGEILVNEPDSEAPTIRQRTPPTRWCANIALRIKVFHLIIQGGISSSGYRPVLSLLFSVPKSRKHKIKKLILRL